MIRFFTVAALAIVAAGATDVSAQDVVWHAQASQQVDHMTFVPAGAQRFEMMRAEPLERIPPVRNSPFSAEAINEFTQMLADGNRIERRYSTSLWRDSQGRTRREQEIALVGPLNVNGDPPRLITIDDPVAMKTYTLDRETKTARTSAVIRLATVRRVEGGAAGRGARVGVASVGSNADFILNGPSSAAIAVAPTFTVATAPMGEPTVESLGTRTIEGVEAEGTRTTTTIAAGAIGNVNAIDVVTERWFSKELQTAVMITRRDPQSGDTVYRLTNIVRQEPPADLFVVPGDYAKK